METSITKLNAKNVHNIFMECLFADGEDHSNYVEAEGVVNRVSFNPQRLKDNEPKIVEMLSQLPDEFRKEPKGGGGWSFLNIVADKTGMSWTDFHQTADELVMLGLATKKLSYLLPRNMWKHLAGGMPYLVLND